MQADEEGHRMKYVMIVGAFAVLAWMGVMVAPFGPEADASKTDLAACAADAPDAAPDWCDEPLAALR